MIYMNWYSQFFRTVWAHNTANGTYSLKPKGRQIDNLLFTGGTTRLHSDNCRCSQWRNGRHCHDHLVSFLPLSPPGWRSIVVMVRAGGRAGGCQTCGTHISVTAWWIFTVRSSVELSRPVVVPCHGQLPICPIWTCPWAKNSSNLAKIGSRLCGTHISETTGWIYPIWSFMDLSGPAVVQRHSYLPICSIWACPWAKNLSNQAVLST